MISWRDFSRLSKVLTFPKGMLLMEAVGKMLEVLRGEENDKK